MMLLLSSSIAVLLADVARAARIATRTPACHQQNTQPNSSSYGSGCAGSWLLHNVSGGSSSDGQLPAYRVHPSTLLPNSFQSGFQLGNDRYVALVSGDGSLSVRQDEGSPKLLTGGLHWQSGATTTSSSSGGVSITGGGLGYLQFSPTPFVSGGVGMLGTHWPLNLSLASVFPTTAPSLSREIGVGTVRKVAITSDLTVDHTLTAPYGEDPVIVSEVQITNTGHTVWDAWWTEAWPSQWAHLGFFHTMAQRAGSNFTGFLDPVAFTSDHYGIRYERLSNGLVERRRWLGLTATEAAELRRINRVLDASNESIAGLTPHSVNASVWDRAPPSVFLVSLDGAVERVGNDAQQFFGGDASAPRSLVEQAFEGSAQRKLPWNDTVTGQHSALLVSRKLEMLEPGETVKLRFLWGYDVDGSRQRLVAKYRSRYELLKDNARAWRANTLHFQTDEPSLAWVGRELTWHDYMLRAATTYDDFFEERTVNQGNYLYGGFGLNAAARDPLQHVLPLIATQPSTARGVILGTMKQMVTPRSWPKGYQQNLLPYALMSHGLVWPDKERGPSDLDLYALLTASEYVLQTKDVAFLSDRVHTYTMFGGTGKRLTVLDCLLACFDHLIGPDIGTGEHGLLRMLSSDWSDVIWHDRAGIEYGTTEWDAAVRLGESVMNSALAAFVLPRFFTLLRMAGHAMASNVSAFGEQQADAMRRSAWAGKWFKRAFISPGRGWIGDEKDQIETGAQPWAVLAGVLSKANTTLLLSAIQTHLRANATWGAKQLARGYRKSTDDAVGLAENGAVWHALNYPLAWALHTVDPMMGLDEFKRNAMATHAELFPSQMNGIWTASDWSASSLAASAQYGQTGVLCMHRHAWPLFAAMRILGGVVSASQASVQLTNRHFSDFP
jgi:hypothetical protein